MISLIPMAGKGSRFQVEGYRLPKPFIPVMGKPMFAACLSSLPQARKTIFICPDSFLRQYPFAGELSKIKPETEILALEKPTEGQACTCLKAKGLLNPHESLLISSIDYQLIYNNRTFREMTEKPEIDVIVMSFKTGSILKKKAESFAYCRQLPEDPGKICEIVEKKTISPNPQFDPAVTGTFWFRKAADFIWCAQKMIAENLRVNGEFYVGTSINFLIQAGKNVQLFPVDKFISFGDPFELELYQFWEEFFYQSPFHPHGTT
jgi:bifunctional N-acetylglucosamine-1-phosphate-uridyltransferase/glucosamine-1-phosphate-acetyltransferase GlmU-like protein